MADFGNVIAISDSTALQALYEVRAAYIDAALDNIEQHYDGMAQFLEHQMGLDGQGLDALQRMYLD